MIIRRVSIILSLLSIALILLAIVALPIETGFWYMGNLLMYWIGTTLLLFVLWEIAAELARRSRVVLPILALLAIVSSVVVTILFPLDPYAHNLRVFYVVASFSMIPVAASILLVWETALGILSDLRVSRGAFAASGIALFIFLLSWANYEWGHWEPVFVMGALVVVWLETAFADGSSMSALGSKRRLSAKSLLAFIVVSLLTTFIIWITALLGTGRVT